MQRRDLLVAAVAVAAAAAAHAQPFRPRPLIVWFASASEAAASRYIGFLKEGLEELGVRDGRDFDLAGRFAEFHVERLSGIAEEIVALRPAIIVCGAVDTAVAARKVTSTIPIVSAALADAVNLGLIASFAHPGGNATGITPYIGGLPSKQLELARELVPAAKRVGLVGNMNDPKAPPQRDELAAAAHDAGVGLIIPDIANPADLDGAVTALAAGKAEVAIVLQTTMLLGHRQNLARLMAASRLPAVYGYREHVDEGGLISYGVDLRWCWHHLAGFVQKILAGAVPADLPIEFPPKLQLVVNLRTAATLGIAIPQLVLARADDVIE
jgi:putative tryptophan/tyrosine transport system substrate-binding protein